MVRLAALSVLLLAGFGVLGAGAQSAPAPSVQIQKRAPVIVAGRHFRQRESVRVVLTAGDARWVGATLANTAGSFAVQISGAKLGRCVAGTLRAAGSNGSRATLRIPPLGCSTE